MTTVEYGVSIQQATRQGIDPSMLAEWARPLMMRMIGGTEITLPELRLADMSKVRHMVLRRLYSQLRRRR